MKTKVLVPEMNTKPIFPTIYYKATCAAEERQNIFARLLAANITLLAIPPVVDAAFGLGEGLPKLVLFNSCIFGAVLSTIGVMLQTPKEHLDCLRLAESAKTLGWQYMTKTKPFAGANDDAKSLLLNRLEELLSKHGAIVGYIAAQKCRTVEIEELEQVRDLPLNERVMMYANFRILSQKEDFAKRAANTLKSFQRISYLVIAIQLLTLVFCWMPHIPKLPTYLETDFGKWALACIAVTIGLLSWRDSQKLKETNNSLGRAAELLEPLYAKSKTTLTESQFASLVEKTEKILAHEHRLWMLSSGASELDEKEEHASSLVNRYVQRPIQITATRVHERTEVKTLEGLEIAMPGDWVLTGLQGERWPVGHDTFIKKYKAVEGKPDKYSKLPIEVEAIQMGCSFSVSARWGEMKGHPGDWLVLSSPSDSYICANEIFLQSYDSA